MFLILQGKRSFQPYAKKIVWTLACSSKEIFNIKVHEAIPAVHGEKHMTLSANAKLFSFQMADLSLWRKLNTKKTKKALEEN